MKEKNDNQEGIAENDSFSLDFLIFHLKHFNCVRYAHCSVRPSSREFWITHTNVSHNSNSIILFHFNSFWIWLNFSLKKLLFTLINARLCIRMVKLDLIDGKVLLLWHAVCRIHVCQNISKWSICIYPHYVVITTAVSDKLIWIWILISMMILLCHLMKV